MIFFSYGGKKIDIEDDNYESARFSSHLTKGPQQSLVVFTSNILMVQIDIYRTWEEMALLSVRD